MIWNFDLQAAPEPEEGESRGPEVLLACAVGGDECRVLSWLQWFTEKGNTRALRWASSWDGVPLPENFRPYAWSDDIEVPDPAAAP